MKNNTELKGKLIFEKELKLGENDYEKTFLILLANFKDTTNSQKQKCKNKCIEFANYFFSVMTLQQLASITLADSWFIESILPQVKISKTRKEYLKVFIEMNKHYTYRFEIMEKDFHKDLKELQKEINDLSFTIRAVDKEMENNRNYNYSWSNHS